MTFYGCPDPNCAGRTEYRFKPMKKDGKTLPSYGTVCITMHRNLVIDQSVVGLPSDCGYYREEFGEWKVSEGKTWTYGNHQEVA